MKTMDVTHFSKHCLDLLDRLDAAGLILTKHGKPVARVMPYDRPCADLIGSLQRKIKVRGDILTTGIWTTP